MRCGSAIKHIFTVGNLKIADCDAAKRCLCSANIGRMDSAGDGAVGMDSIATTSVEGSPPLSSTKDAPPVEFTSRPPERRDAWDDQMARPRLSPSRQWYPIVSAFKSMVKISLAKRREEQLDPLVLSLTWEECAQLAIKNADNLTSFEIAHIANSCKNGMYINLDLLRALVDRGQHPEVLKSFDPAQISITTLSFGTMARKARDNYNEAAEAFLTTAGQDFIRNLLRVALDRNLLCSARIGHVGLSSLMKGMGLLFMKEGGDVVDEAAEVIAEDFCKKIVFYECSTQSFGHFLYGCFMLGYKNQEILDTVVQSIVHSLVTFQDFSDMLGSILFSLGGLEARHAELVDMLSWRLVANLKTIHGKELVRAAIGLRCLNYSNERILKLLCMEVVSEHRLESFSAGALISLINSLGNLKMDTQQIMPLVLELLKPHRLAKVESKHWSLLMYGLGAVGLKDFAVLNTLGEYLSRPDILPGITDRVILLAVYNFWILGYSNTVVMGQFEKEVLRRLSSFSEKDVWKMANGLEAMAAKNPSLLDSMCEAVTSSSRALACSEQAFCNLVLFLSHLEINNRDLWMALGKEALSARRAGKFKPGQWTSLILCFSSHGFFDAEMMVGVMTELKSQLSEFSTNQVVQVFQGLGKWGDELEPVRGRMIELLSMLGSKLKDEGFKSLSVQEIEVLTWGMGQLRYFDEDLLKESISHAKAEFDTKNSGNHKAFVTLVKACASLNFRDTGLLQFVKEHRTCTKLNRFGQVATLMWGLALLDGLSDSEFKELCGLLESLEAHQSTELHWRQIVQSWFHVHILGKASRSGHIDASALSSTEADPPIVARAKERCKASKLVQRSQFESRVKELLDEAGISSQCGVVLLGGLIDVDLFIEGEPPVVIECDGPWHYTTKKVHGVYLEKGETIFRNKVLEALGYKVVCLPFYCDEIEQLDLISQALDLNRCGISKGGTAASGCQQILDCVA